MPVPPAVATDAIPTIADRGTFLAWLVDRFRERHDWGEGDLTARAAADGVDFEASVLRFLPTTAWMTTRGERHWRARDGWPGPIGLDPASSDAREGTPEPVGAIEADGDVSRVSDASPGLVGDLAADASELGLASAVVLAHLRDEPPDGRGLTTFEIADRLRGDGSNRDDPTFIACQAVYYLVKAGLIECSNADSKEMPLYRAVCPEFTGRVALDALGCGTATLAAAGSADDSLAGLVGDTASPGPDADILTRAVFADFRSLPTLARSCNAIADWLSARRPPGPEVTAADVWPVVRRLVESGLVEQANPDAPATAPAMYRLAGIGAGPERPPVPPSQETLERGYEARIDGLMATLYKVRSLCRSDRDSDEIVVDVLAELAGFEAIGGAA